MLRGVTKKEHPGSRDGDQQNRDRREGEYCLARPHRSLQCENPERDVPGKNKIKGPENEVYPPEQCSRNNKTGGVGPFPGIEPPDTPQHAQTCDERAQRIRSRVVSLIVDVAQGEPYNTTSQADGGPRSFALILASTISARPMQRTEPRRQDVSDTPNNLSLSHGIT